MTDTMGAGGMGSRIESPTHFLIYDVETHDYRGTASDGALVMVAEQVFTQQVRALVQEMVAKNGSAYSDAAAYQRFHRAAIALLSNADAWRDQ